MDGARAIGTCAGKGTSFKDCRKRALDASVVDAPIFSLIQDTNLASFFSTRSCCSTTTTGASSPMSSTRVISTLIRFCTCRITTRNMVQQSKLDHEHCWEELLYALHIPQLTLKPFTRAIALSTRSKKKAFTISIVEYPETIRSLWNTTRSFMQKYSHLLAEDNSLEFISDDDGETYNVRRFYF